MRTDLSAKVMNMQVRMERLLSLQIRGMCRVRSLEFLYSTSVSAYLRDSASSLGQVAHVGAARLHARCRILFCPARWKALCVLRLKRASSRHLTAFHDQLILRLPPVPALLASLVHEGPDSISLFLFQRWTQPSLRGDKWHSSGAIDGLLAWAHLGPAIALHGAVGRCLGL